MSFALDAAAALNSVQNTLPVQEIKSARGWGAPARLTGWLQRSTSGGPCEEVPSWAPTLLLFTQTLTRRPVELPESCQSYRPDTNSLQCWGAGVCHVHL